jgi:leucyl-tRNA synthetase
MGVPAHDTRDFAFAKKYGIPIRVVIRPEGKALDAETMDDAFVDDGVMVNSGALDGTPYPSGMPKVIEYFTKKGIGRATVQFRLRDWLISRQRYWGCPIPIIHCEKCGPQPVPEEDLPVLLPQGQVDFMPKARSPLEDNEEFMKAACPKCGGGARRDPDTMDTFMCSSFYLFRYVDPHNEKEIWRRGRADAWMPVDIYIGGVEHACMHLLYFRFITKVLFDAGLLPADEPVVRLFNHGMVLDAKGEIMSKSKGNVVSPGETMDRWGVDVCRLAMLFFAPSDDEVRWKEDGLIGARRFVQRIWERVHGLKEEGDHKALRRKLHQVIRKVTRSMESDLHFNTSMAAIMELMNTAPAFPKDVAKGMVQLLAPMAPFLGEELWAKLGHKESVFRSGWPEFDAELAKEEEIEIVLQINGRVRGRVTVPAGISDDDLQKRALESDEVKKHLCAKEPRKVIVVKGRLVNVVV